MPEREREHCPECGAAMDVSGLSPFTKVCCPDCAAHHRVKCRFGPYQLQARHAVGGMSRVFLARDRMLDREVVVKILNEQYSVDGARIRAFEREARVTAAISHPHVVRVLTTGHAHGLFYIAMEFVPGGHFEHHIHERGRVPEREALRLALQVAEGLDAAKRAGLIHRDVKPGNILLDAHGDAKLVDFGLALVTRAGKARAHEIWATPYYVPPEAIEGGEEDFRSDIYAFGATFYHALAGDPPCDERSLNSDRLLEAKREIRPLREVVPEVSRTTAAVIARCMAYEASRRYPSYVELMDALRLAAKTADGGGERVAAVRGERRRRWWLPAAAVAALLATGGFLVHRNRAPDPPPVAQPAPGPGGFRAEEPTGPDVRELLRQYLTARQAVARGDFDAAASGFARVRDHPGVLEPTASLAACEVAIARLAQGRGKEAWLAVGAAREHLRATSGLDEDIANGLDQLLSASRELPVAVPGVFADAPHRSVPWMLAALENWQQGRFDIAEPQLRAVAEAGVADDVYPGLARRYLADLARLQAAEPLATAPGSGEDRIAKLGTVLDELETHGRAPEQVRSWIEQLQREAETQPAATSPQPPAKISDPTARPADLDTLLASGHFHAALERMKDWQPDPGGRERERQALISLAQAALAFLADLGERLPGSQGELVTRQGEPLGVLLSADDRQVRVRAADGGERTLDWTDVDPACLIELYRGTVDRRAAESERLRRHEQALAFDLLSGDTERAREGGRRLGAKSEDFRRRWQRMSEAWPH